MPSSSRIREQIADIIGRPRNVRFSEIKRIMDQLNATERTAAHGQLFNVNGRRVMINKHNNGKETIPKYSVDEFRDAMIELGLYED